jgi:hypothetical protein
MLIALMALSTGCAPRARIPAEAIPPFPEPGFSFEEKDGLLCLDDENARAFFFWTLELERYKGAVETLR